MKTFRFTLQALQILREREHQAALEHYARAVAVCQRALEQLGAREIELEAAWSQLRDRQVANATALVVMQTEAWCQTVAARKRECAMLVARAQEAMKQSLQLLLGARQKKEIVDQFLHHQRQRYDRELQRDEQKMLDELAVCQAGPVTFSMNWEENNLRN